MRWVVLAVAALVLVGCEAEAEPPPALAPSVLSAGEVAQLFADWVCPTNPRRGAALDPAPSFNAHLRSWTIRTGSGSATMSESTRIFVPAADGAYLTNLRSSCLNPK